MPDPHGSSVISARRALRLRGFAAVGEGEKQTPTVDQEAARSM